MRTYLVFDIETAPLEWENFSESQQEYWLRGTNTEEEIETRLSWRSLTPLTGRILCIGMMIIEQTEDGWNVQKKGCLSTNPDLQETEIFDEILVDDVKMQLSNERKVLEDFWKIMVHFHYPTLITFNGRMFDVPFIMLRSAVYQIRPPYNIMSGTKFNYPNHIDLIDELTFYSPQQWGATKKFNFDFYSHSFGIVSPKSQGVNGAVVPEMFANGQIKEISEYCMRDVKATWELFLYWNEYLNFNK
ncbi:MAG: ribonuclease H-like domain-containing protein [Ignavibacteria bacterium]|jgi:DNA polymerase elongation subunit (family B)|nr:ribonuclease H-like domain-containing protein [Ignavibacteria bacterium]